MSANTTPSVNSQMIDAAREAGARPWFTLIAAIDPEAVEEDHNYVAGTLAGAFEDPDQPTVEEAEMVPEQAGHFISALWEGDLAEALYRADLRNTRFIVRTFHEDILLEHLARDRGSMESARRWLEPVLEDHR